MPTATRAKKASKGRGGRPARGPVGTLLAQATVLRGAADVFNKHGTDDVPVQEILEAAGVSRATFYKHFRGKDQLVEALFEVASNALLGAVEAAVEKAESPMERLRAGLRAYLTFHASDAGVVRVLQAAAQRAGSPIATQREQAHARLVEVFQRELVRAGRHRVDPLLLRGAVIAMEGISNVLLTEAAAGHAIAVERAERCMLRLLAGALAESSDALPPLPLEKAH